MSTLTGIAAALAELYESRAELGYRAWKNERDTEARQIALTPAEGWPGSNDKARLAYQAGAFAHDAVLVSLAEEQRLTTREQAELTGKVEALEAERRALEWQIRARLVDSLDRAGVQPNSRADRAEAAFDDAGQRVLDEAF